MNMEEGDGARRKAGGGGVRGRRRVWGTPQGWRAAKSVPTHDFQQGRWGLSYMWLHFENLKLCGHVS